MLPFFFISNAPISDRYLVDQFLESADVHPAKLVSLESQGFHVLMLPAPDNVYYQSEENLVVINGFIRHPNFEWDWEGSNEVFLQKLLHDLASKDAETIKKEYTGNFTVLYFAKKKVEIFNTFSGLQPIYYHAINGNISICSAIICLQKFVKEKVRTAGILQMALNEWNELYTRATMLTNVKRLVSNEYVSLGNDGSCVHKIIPFKVDYKSEDISIMDCVQSVWEGYKEIGRLFAGKNLNAAISLSGGVDSRTCAKTVAPHAKKFVAVNHGGPRYYEYERAAEVAKALHIPIHLANSRDKMFPNKKDLHKYFLHDGGVVIEYMAIKDEQERQNFPPVLIFGDLFETFKVDGTSIWEGRSMKQKTTLNLMKGGSIQLETVENFGFEKWVEQKADYFMAKLNRHAHMLQPEMAAFFKSDAGKAEIRADFVDWLADFKHYNVKYVEDLNEVAYWLSKGRTSMWLQSSSSSGYSAGFTLYCTDKNLAEILSVPLKHKLRQKLHFYMFRLPEFEAIAKIPSPQIPFTNISAALPYKELVMYLRLKMDKIYAKKAAKNPETDRPRFLRGPNYKREYNNESLVKYESWFNDVCISKETMVRYFTDIQTGKMGAYSTMDFIGLAKAEFMAQQLKTLEKQ